LRSYLLFSGSPSLPCSLLLPFSAKTCLVPSVFPEVIPDCAVLFSFFFFAMPSELFVPLFPILSCFSDFPFCHYTLQAAPARGLLFPLQFCCLVCHFFSNASFPVSWSGPLWAFSVFFSRVAVRQFLSGLRAVPLAFCGFLFPFSYSHPFFFELCQISLGRPDYRRMPIAYTMLDFSFLHRVSLLTFPSSGLFLFIGFACLSSLFHALLRGSLGLTPGPGRHANHFFCPGGPLPDSCGW